MDKKHDHIGIGVVMVIMVIFTFAGFLWLEQRIEGVADRITELEQRIECVAPESLFFDADGNTVCLETLERR